MNEYLNVNFLLLVSRFLQPKWMKIGSAGKGAPPQTENSGSVPALAQNLGSPTSTNLLPGYPIQTFKPRAQNKQFLQGGRRSFVWTIRNNASVDSAILALQCCECSLYLAVT